MAFAVILGLLFGAMIAGGIPATIVGGIKTGFASNSDNYTYRNNYNESKQRTDLKKGKTLLTFGILGLIIGFCSIITIPGSIHQVDTGEVAVVRHLGKIEGTRDPGIYWDFGWTCKYEKYDTTVHELSYKNEPVYTLDKQTVTLDVLVQYEIEPSNVDLLAARYGSIGKVESKMKTDILDGLKSVIAKNTADSLIENRNIITTDISLAVSNVIASQEYYVTFKSAALSNYDFTEDYEAAVAAKVAEEQKKQQADIENAAAIAKAEAEAAAAKAKAEGEAEVARIQAEAAAEVAKIQAEADAEVAKIQADSAEYQGKKDAAIMMNKLASVNGWYVMTVYDTDGITVVGYKLMTGLGSPVTQAELEVGVERLIQVLIAEKWDGQLPTYMMSESGVITVLYGNSSSSEAGTGSGD